MKKIILSGMALALLALACGEESVTDPKVDYRALPSSPANVLKNVERAFNHRDVNLLRAMLSENFVFYFDPDDVGQQVPGGGYVIPESWTRAEFISAAGKMFKKAYIISFTIPTGGVGEPDPNATTYKAENVNIQLLVMFDELNGFLANSGYCNFEFERYEGKTGEKFWRLVKWWDRTNPMGDGYTSTMSFSFGLVLASVYQ